MVTREGIALLPTRRSRLDPWHSPRPARVGGGSSGAASALPASFVAPVWHGAGAASRPRAVVHLATTTPEVAMLPIEQLTSLDPLLTHRRRTRARLLRVQAVLPAAEGQARCHSRGDDRWITPSSRPTVMPSSSPPDGALLAWPAHRQQHAVPCALARRACTAPQSRARPRSAESAGGPASGFIPCST
jgi:hypothetical protein